ncbi:DUF1566 domain-containing protein [Leptospira gomenensis]|uniref:DUF1566 domain-containing protein n=1 Tax=Leptospira gomenensis TaxID=2484974 RepID=A0A5F1YTX0_9LEPT|nr:DUF1566 domain-containing protein [Leptospira gomenensis]TGK31678.1 DUF1566 domain-containing protein [Leptospira gomenensis]TGK41693.1 DUF1566 domain-containing protein [Leptospira gomenensis]TGK43353.1 DUF1566 domain-containing protein [Leptospira gomenensis]TGK61347.1 DUF1566 domain-containing protein [Leptospira gomenensis]
MKSVFYLFISIFFLVKPAAGYSGPFQDNGNNTISDTRSGLIWQKCIAGLTAADCSGGAALSMNWTNALNYCNALMLNGVAGWRLPSIKELLSTVNYNSTDYTLPNAYFPSPGNPIIQFMWSSTGSAANTSRNNAYALRYNGEFSLRTKSTAFHIRCVRNE